MHSTIPIQKFKHPLWARICDNTFFQSYIMIQIRTMDVDIDGPY